MGRLNQTYHEEQENNKHNFIRLSEETLEISGKTKT
jgi:hypothetical protein